MSQVSFIDMIQRTILIVLVIAGSFLAGNAHAQAGSAAFDPNIYRPVIGNRLEIDTIYGSTNFYQLGSGISNLPNAIDPSKRTIIYAVNNKANGTLNSPPYFSFDATPVFNIRKFKLTSKPINVKIDQGVVPGHFHSTKYVDLLHQDIADGGGVFIFWSDENGEYDSSRVSELKFRPLNDSNIFDPFAISGPYIAKLTSDSLDDIVWGSFSYYPHTAEFDTLYVGLFKGGEKLYQQGKIIYPDSQIPSFHIDIKNFYDLRGSHGDFRGVGKDDYLIADKDGNLCHYKFHAPFSLSEFAHSIHEDTIFAAWQNPQTKVSWNGIPFYSYPLLPMKAFPKIAGDKSVDVLVPIQRNDHQDMSIYFFKGGASFGSKRIFVDSADFRMHDPAYYDPFTFGAIAFGQGYQNCGDLTGTGNNVLCVTSNSPTGEAGLMLLYVLGDQLDDKIDVLIPQSNGGTVSGLDTVDANGDGLEDLLIGMEGYTSDRDINKGLSHIGSMGIFYGSKRIPIHKDGVFSNPEFMQSQSFTVSPNPSHRNITVGIQMPAQKVQPIRISIFDVLGRRVLSTTIPPTIASGNITIPFYGFSSGMYVVEVSCNGTFYSQKILW